MMQLTDMWKVLFETWPDSIERKGVLCSKQGEAITFGSFFISGAFLLLERSTPDASGSRRVIIPYDEIALVKLATNVETSMFQAMGFQLPVAV